MPNFRRINDMEKRLRPLVTQALFADARNATPAMAELERLLMEDEQACVTLARKFPEAMLIKAPRSGDSLAHVCVDMSSEAARIVFETMDLEIAVETEMGRMLLKSIAASSAEALGQMISRMPGALEFLMPPEPGLEFEHTIAEYALAINAIEIVDIPFLPVLSRLLRSNIEISEGVRQYALETLNEGLMGREGIRFRYGIGGDVEGRQLTADEETLVMELMGALRAA
ncbi:MAG: hypothetical protein KGH72_03780 [Candidatus Micrarchaeota archaeon]|nr:hypothetical protein [Candidatus Micrarchaeota archaeon]